MLAGLGIGGIALVLDAQKILEDLFGGISIIMGDSIRLDDYCRVADQTGTIERYRTFLHAIADGAPYCRIHP
jgi:MscS family membrane protein